MIWAFVFLAYLVGATPTSYLVGRAVHGIDLRDHGSGNLGATNVFRVLGWKSALPVAIVDIAKGALPVALFPLWDGAADPTWALAYGAAAIVGHVFSVFVRFKGGKGVATSAGVFTAVAPWATLVALLVWALVVATTRIVSLGSLSAAVALPVAIYFTGEPLVDLWAALGLALFVTYAHRSNIRRLLRGEENRFGRKESTTP